MCFFSHIIWIHCVVLAQNSSYFASNAVPLKLAFSNSSTSAPEICIMYKVANVLNVDSLAFYYYHISALMCEPDNLDTRQFGVRKTGRRKYTVLKNKKNTFSPSFHIVTAPALESF